jgi:hypothetical protein
MFDDTYKSIPRDEIEAKSLKELMGYNIELPKARLLQILRDEGGDVDCASARAFIEMRDQYKAQRGEITTTTTSDGHQHQQTTTTTNTATTNNNNNNYYDYSYRDTTTGHNENAHNLNAFRSAYDDIEYNNDYYHENNNYDMTFDAKVVVVEPSKNNNNNYTNNKNNNNDDDQQQQTKTQNHNDPYYFEEGSYMLRVRSKDYGSSNELQYQNDRRMGDRVESFGLHPAEDIDDSDSEEQKKEKEKEKQEETKKFPGIFMKTFGWGGFVANKTSYNAVDGSFMYPYSFVNEGVRIIRLDNDHDSHTHTVNVVDTSNLEDDEFEALCDEWLDETYDATEVPDMFHEGADYRTAKAKSDHDFKMFELYTQFEKELSKGFSLSACLTTFVQAQQKANRFYRTSLGLPPLPGTARTAEED